MSVCVVCCNASFLLCSSLMIFYTTMFQFSILDHKDEKQFLCIHDAHDYNVENYVLLLDDYHSSSKEICDEREMHMMKR